MEFIVDSSLSCMLLKSLIDGPVIVQSLIDGPVIVQAKEMQLCAFFFNWMS